VATATLLVIQGVDQGSRFDIGDAPVGIGRGVKNEFRILDTEVSRQHAQFYQENGEFFVADRGSSNGTFVNGVPIRTHVLSNGDQIQCGRTVILFTNPDAVDDESRYIAERVDFLPQDSPEDRSKIISAVRDDTDNAIPTQAAPEPEVVERTFANLQALYRISEEAVSPSISLDQLLKRVLDVTIEVVGADRGCILIRNLETEDIVPQAFSDRREADGHVAKMPVSRSIVDYVLREEHGVRTSDARHDQRFEPGQSILQAGIREAMCVPIQGRRDLLGVIYVDTTSSVARAALEPDAATFTDDQLRLLSAIGRQTAQAVETNRYQQALVSAERMAAMGQTIAMLSHHIKNILQGIRGGSYLIDMGLKDHQEDLVRKGWNIVEKNQGRIYHLVMDMLTFSKERQPALESADVNETVAEVCELMQARAEECKVAFRYDPSDDLPPTTFDREGIHRAVLNIVINALDACEGREAAAVTVRTGYDPQEDTLHVEIQDNGPGIPPDQLPNIFNLFASTKGTRGTGLGLAVSQKIIREHSGRIEVQSEPGEGSRFTLIWPRFEEESKAAEGGR
jgi:two-component system, NtrC family, sensor kinase